MKRRITFVLLFTVLISTTIVVYSKTASLINTDDGVVDSNWSVTPFATDPVGDTTGSSWSDIVNVWYSANVTSTEYYFRIEVADTPDPNGGTAHIELDCNNNGKFTDETIDKKINYWAGYDNPGDGLNAVFVTTPAGVSVVSYADDYGEVAGKNYEIKALVSDMCATPSFGVRFSTNFGSDTASKNERDINPGQSTSDPEFDGTRGDSTPSYVDVTGISSSLSGELLTVIFKLRDIPPALVFNREDVEKWYTEYWWNVSVDIDNNPATGAGSNWGNQQGMEYVINAMHSVPDDDTPPVSLPIEQGVDNLHVAKYQSNNFSNIGNATISVDANLNTLTLSGNIPGINAQSRLVFFAMENDGNNSSVDYVLYKTLVPILTVNHTEGKPGSYFTLTGKNYPSDSTASISVNGKVVGTVQTDIGGAFVIELNTNEADEGAYFVTITAGSSKVRVVVENVVASENVGATVGFTLDLNSPNIWTSEGGADKSFNVPAGIAFTKFVYLPLIQR